MIKKGLPDIGWHENWSPWSKSWSWSLPLFISVLSSILLLENIVDTFASGANDVKISEVFVFDMNKLEMFLNTEWLLTSG